MSNTTVIPTTIGQKIFEMLDAQTQKEVMDAFRDQTLLKYISNGGVFHRVTKNQAIDLIRSNNGFISAKFKTSADVLKRGNPHPSVEKVWTANCIFGIHWRDLLNRLLVKLGKEPNYEVASTRSNGTVPVDSKISTKEMEDGEVRFYLTTYPIAYLETLYFDTETGKQLTLEEVTPFLKKHSQSKMNRHGLTKEALEEIGAQTPRFLTVGIDSLQVFKMNGQFYEVID